MKKIIRILLIIIIVLIVIVYLLYVLNYIPHKKYLSRDFKIEEYKSLVDMDQDLVDDQTDILNGVRNYIERKPKYKSKYYKDGYPTDNYGVCTDVVAFGMRNAGYDLKELVYDDIINNKNEYDIDIIDKNIDFRRVRNLKVYFKRKAINLTTDISKIEEWQGGDIVIFENHIGIVSNYRNKKGIPFVIHHASVYQTRYEEDILESKFYKVVGHFRVS